MLFIYVLTVYLLIDSTHPYTDTHIYIIQNSCPPNAIHICRNICTQVSILYIIQYTIADRLHCRDEKHNGIICNQETVKVVPFEKWWRRASLECCWLLYCVRMSGNFEMLHSHTFCTPISRSQYLRRVSKKYILFSEITKSLIKCINITTLGLKCCSLCHRIAIASLPFHCSDETRKFWRRKHNLRRKKKYTDAFGMLYIPGIKKHVTPINARLRCRTSCKI